LHVHSILIVNKMKFKQSYIFIPALAIAFFTAQSFYHRFRKEKAPLGRAWFKPFPGHVALCIPAYIGADSAIDIPALKGWGNYSWKISTKSDSVQFYFNQGISLYYGFHMIEAIASFTRATHIDPSCAMAWYGRALAMGPTINYANGYTPPNDAFKAARKSQQLSAGCAPLEKDLITAIEQRYREDTSVSIKQLRINYAAAMKKVYEKYPHNADVVTLYADALLLLHPWDLYTHDFKPKPWTPQIRSLLETAMKIYPDHPGANHYYIHTMEASATPQLALKSAHVLDTLMPLVSHVTHMPSHIYIRTGHYQQGIKNNDAAIAGYNNYLMRYAPVANGSPLYELHNMHLKVNCAQMAGNYKIANEGSLLLQSKLKDFLSLPGADGNYVQYLFMEPAFTAVRFGKWNYILDEKPVDTLAYASVIQHFARGLAYCGKGKSELAQSELKKLEEKMQDRSLKLNMDNFSPAYDAANVARTILQGVIADAQKQYAASVDFFQKAVAAEDHIIYNEPRDWPLPAREYLGNELIKAGRYDEAIAVFNKDLFINPNNGWSLTGLQSAYQSTNNSAALAKVQQHLKQAWKIKDVEIKKAVF